MQQQIVDSLIRGFLVEAWECCSKQGTRSGGGNRTTLIREDQMGLLRLFLYDQPMSFGHFVLELVVVVILVALAGSYFAAKTLIELQVWFR